MQHKIFGKAFALLVIVLSALAVSAQTVGEIPEKDVRADMQFLASDAMKGRGSGSEEERIAGEYFGSQMERFGIEPGGDTDADGNRSYVQTVGILRQAFAEPPTLTYTSGNATTVLTHGKEMIVFQINSGSVSGPLQKLGPSDKPKAGSVVLARNDPSEKSNSAGRFSGLFDSSAAAVLVEETPQFRAGWQRSGARKVSISRFEDGVQTSRTALIVISTEAAEALSAMPEGTEVKIGGELAEPEITHTWNSIGFLKGSDPKLASEVILLSAHMDHLGVRPNAPGDDKIFNGADDDASGCVAVIELARVLAAGKRPKRTVYFVFFGSEEAGGWGARYFVENLPFPKDKLIANLQWEMIGRPDPKVAPDELWLTGFDRSNLGAELAKHGAKLVNDPHPEQNFFQRSDNFTLARQGIIAHTVSSYGLHTDYHQASDEYGTIDFAHMTKAINSMVGPIRWLVNSDFRPTWYEGKDPSQ